MVNGEGWLKGGVRADLTVIPCQAYDHNMTYELPVRPSPNIKDLRATLLYPSICFFEGTHASEGRGIESPFVIFGHPAFSKGDYKFTPGPKPGAKSSKLYGQECSGFNLSRLSIEEIKSWKRINLSWFLSFYNDLNGRVPFFLENNFFNKLAGNKELMQQIQSGLTENQIRASWQPGIDSFKEIRKKYLLYPDFE
jgi:uncharacterized protein YbbC (DUF1343 family)